MGLPAVSRAAESAPAPAQADPQSPSQQQNTKASLRATAQHAIKLEMSPKNEHLRRCQLTLDTFSPVNQNGSFEFDRVIKSGQVLKRRRKTKSWKPIQLILRPNLLSIYKDNEGTKLRHQVILSDVTAVARQRDPKNKAHHVFGLFSPSRNYHFSAPGEADAQDWVELIRQEARIDEEDEEILLASPVLARDDLKASPFGAAGPGNSSSEEPDAMTRATTRTATRPMNIRNGSSSSSRQQQAMARRPSHPLASYSGNEQGSLSDFSDAGVLGSSLSLSPDMGKPRSSMGDGIYGTPPPPLPPPPSRRPGAQRNVSSAVSVGAGSSPVEKEERVVCQGWLYLLKSKGGVRQWRSVWCVLRRKTLALYKNEEEYAALLVVPLSSVLDAGDLDGKKRACFQLIAEERTYRFAAADEEELARWLGAFKSLLVRRRVGATPALASVAAAVAVVAGAEAAKSGEQKSPSRYSGGW